MNKKQNISFILAVFIPLLMILAIIASIYWPHTTVAPKFNFLYLTGDHYNNYDKDRSPQYLVQKGKLVIAKKATKNKARLFIYDIAQHKSQEISFQDAQQLNLDENPKSPDGFEVVSGDANSNANTGIFSLFFGSNHHYYSRYLKNSHAHAVEKINIPNISYDFRFLGWIKNQGDQSYAH